MSAVFQYRPDIDGIRAIAVLLVVIFHAKFSLLSGGFVGVDVFFVISGFLISAIILREYQNNTFSFSSFYLRRIKRLAPALVFLLLLTFIPAYLLLFPDDFEKFSRSMIHAFLSTSNFFLWQNTGGYFSDNTDLFPLLHTWSLAVEEQFYLVWPITFIFLARLFSSRQLPLIIGGLVCGALLLSMYLARTSPHSAYFLLPARAFELLLGASLAVTYSSIPRFSPWQSHVLSIFGFLLIVLPSLLISKQSTFPGLNALWPCLGTVLLICTGRDANNVGVVNKILSTKWFVAIGLISYSLYLWHWPIFSFVQYVGLELSGIVRVLAIILAFLMGYLSWRFIESSIHKVKLPTLKYGMLKFMLPSFILLTIMYGMVDGTNGFPSRFKDLPEFDKNVNFPSTVRKKCFDADIVGNVDECWLGVKKEESQLDGVLIGDSFANHSATFVDVFAKDAGLFIHDSTSGGHPLLTALTPQGDYRYPPDYANERLEYAKKFNFVVLAANWNNYAAPENINYERILNSIAELVAAGKDVSIIISPPATTPENLHKLKLAKAAPFVFFSRVDDQVKKPQWNDDHIVNEMKRRFPTVRFLDMRDVLCSDGLCNLTIDGSILYRNADHLNMSGAKMIADGYLEKYGNPFKI